MIRQLLCGCCTNGCTCSAHAADHKRVVCLSHRAASLRQISLDQWMALTDEQQGSGLYMIDLDRCDHVEHEAREARAFQRDHDEECEGTYR